MDHGTKREAAILAASGALERARRILSRLRMCEISPEEALVRLVGSAHQTLSECDGIPP